MSDDLRLARREIARQKAAIERMVALIKQLCPQAGGLMTGVQFARVNARHAKAVKAMGDFMLATDDPAWKAHGPGPEPGHADEWLERVADVR